MEEKREKWRKRREYTPEYRAEVVRLCQVGDRSVGKICKELGLTESAVRTWIRRAETEAGHGPAGSLTESERDELVRLRKENKKLQMERDILKKATAFFANEHP